MQANVIAVLDDDPTGSQTVHDVPIVLALDDEALTLDAPTTFFLTNSRSLPEVEAAELTERVARRLFEQDPEVEIVSRSDSTLRGHVAAEVAAIERARIAVTGEGYDAILFAPAFFEAGRYTRDDIHYAGDVPVGETEFARDATFGYRSSNLRDFVREKVGDDARRWEIVNAESYEDLDAVVREARASGRRLLYRTGPSFVRALAGIEPIDAADRPSGVATATGCSSSARTSGSPPARSRPSRACTRSSSTSPRSTPTASGNRSPRPCASTTSCSTRAASSSAATTRWPPPVACRRR